jgi:hypothetical protein
VFAHPWDLLSARGFLQSLLDALSTSMLVATGQHAGVLQQCIEEMPEIRGNLVHDLHTAVLMREHGIARIVTRDADFRRFEFLDVIDPLRARAVNPVDGERPGTARGNFLEELPGHPLGNST